MIYAVTQSEKDSHLFEIDGLNCLGVNQNRAKGPDALIDVRIGGVRR